MKTKKNFKFAIIIPTYNASKTIALVVNELVDKFPLFHKILVIDNCPFGSYEAAQNIINKKNIYILQRIKNGGVGAASLTGFSYAFDQLKCDYAVKIDADGQMSYEDINLFLSSLKKFSTDEPIFIKGERLSRKIYFGKFKFKRLIGNLIINLMMILSFGHSKLRDPTCGFFLINNITWEKIKFDGGQIKHNYLFETSLLYYLVQKNIFPRLLYVHPNYDDHYSSMKEYRTGFQILYFIMSKYLERINNSYIVQINYGSFFLLMFLLSTFITLLLLIIFLYNGYILNTFIYPGYIAIFVVFFITSILSFFRFLDYDFKN